ncbi:hypothetical protein [Pseudomonas kurunegalensis]|uniref:hypothetical protein n=1 Tax=Pseudomonas kurunegalensis TaxID=485880 RepID=UPI002895DDF1|nr:hypothetical protein [Pseudomonas kurunegalensis]MDT3750463.1 hypothetical protein [Pseudomonas kurunegalensis]
MPTPIDLDDYRADLERIRDARQAWHATFESLEPAQREQMSAQQLREATHATQLAYQAYAGRCEALAISLMATAKLLE